MASNAPVCLNCGGDFGNVAQGRNKRHYIDTKLRYHATPSAEIEDIFGHSLTPGKGALCSDCVNILKKIST